MRMVTPLVYAAAISYGCDTALSSTDQRSKNSLARMVYQLVNIPIQAYIACSPFRELNISRFKFQPLS